MVANQNPLTLGENDEALFAFKGLFLRRENIMRSKAAIDVILQNLMENNHAIHDETISFMGGMKVQRYFSVDKSLGSYA